MARWFLIFFANVTHAFDVGFRDVTRHERTVPTDPWSGTSLSVTNGNAFISDKAVGIQLYQQPPENGDSFGVNFINPEGRLVDEQRLTYSTDIVGSNNLGCWINDYNFWSRTCWGAISIWWQFFTTDITYGKPGTWTFEIVVNDQVTYTGTFGLIPRSLKKSGGDGQTIVIAEDGSFDAIPLSVQLIDYDGSSPKGGEPVTFAIDSAPKGNKGGSITSSVSTNSQGIASANFTPGNKTGSYSIVASTRSDPDNPQTFTINVEVPPSLHGKQEDPLEDVSPPKNLGGGGSACSGTPPPMAGNPINVGTGNKYQHEYDYSTADSFPLVFSRHYNSDSPSKSSLGNYWRGTYDRHIFVYEIGKGKRKTQAADVYHSNGKVYTFTLTDGLWQGEPDVANQLTKTVSGWQYILKNNQVEEYDDSGRLTTLLDRNGRSQQLSYNSANQLTQVSSGFGSLLTFSYNSSGLLASMTDSANNSYQYHYDAVGNLIRADYPDANNRQYLYENIDFPNALTGIIDENGIRFASWNYDALGRAISSEHAEGTEKVDILYNTDGSRVVTNSLGELKTYFLKSSHGSVKVTGVDVQNCPTCLFSSSASFNYDSQGYPNKTVDPNGNTRYFAYNDRGLSISSAKAVGTADEQTSSRIWHNTLNLPIAIHKTGTSLFYDYDNKGNVLQKRKLDTTTKATKIWTYSYTASGSIETEDGPRTDINDITNYQYYSNGRLWRITNSLGHILEVQEYDAHGRATKLKDHNEVITTLAYNQRGQLTSQNTGGEIILQSYDNAGNLIKITLPDQTTTIYQYDGAGRLILARDHWNNETHYQYDVNSHLIKKSIHAQDGTLQQQQSWAYDSTGKLISKTGAAGQVTQYSYDNNDNLIATTDAKSQQTSTDFDALNRPVATHYPDSGIVDKVYDKQDNLISVTDAQGHTTYYRYNGLGQRIETESPDTGVTSYSYDKAGNRIDEIHANGKSITYQYDELNRLTKAIDSSSSATNYLYDSCTNGIGRLCSLTGTGFSSSWQYDTHGRIIARQETTQSASTNTSYQYNALGQLTAMTYPSGKIVSYQYIDGRIEGISINGSAVISQISYNAANQITGWNWANGEITQRSHDQDGQLIQQTLADITRSLAYDPIGNILSIDDGFNLYDYNYDPMSRLSSATANHYDLLYSYDKNGNRLTEEDASNLTDYLYNPLNNQLTEKQGATVKNYQYDLVGNMLSDGLHTFSYDARNQLIDIAGVASYSYNGLGQRVEKNRNSVQTYYVYDENARLIGEYSATGQAITETVYLFGQPVAVLKGSEVYNVHADHLGTPRKISNQTADIIWQWQDKPFGDSTVDQDPDGDGVVFEYNLRFPGQYFDGETGLHYNYYRYYDPSTGRYITSDPIGILRDYSSPQLQLAINYGGLEETGFAGEELNHLYGYVSQNPLYWFDPYGLAAKGGKQNKGSNEFGGNTDAEVAEIARDPNASKEDRRKAQTEEKARKKRHSSQSERSGLTTGEQIGLGTVGLGIAACILFPEVCIPAALVGGMCTTVTQ